MAQTMPATPNNANAARQPQTAIKATVAAGVRLPAKRDPECVIPCANPRSEAASQREKARVALGKAPACPTPNRNRITIRDAAFQANPVRAVKTDHQRTMAESIRRGPIQSTNHPA